MLSNSSNLVRCTVCGAELVPKGHSYNIKDIFALWEPMHLFSQETVERHMKQAEKISYYECSECKLGIFLPMVIGSAGFYEELESDLNARYYSQNKWEFEEAIKDVDGAEKLVEIGCGPGNFLKKIRTHITEVYGTEMNSIALEGCRASGLMVYHPEDCEKQRLHGYCDVAISLHVLEHVAEPMAFIKEQVAFVRPGGKVIFAVPNKEGPLQYIHPCVMDMPPHHATRWSRRTFEKVAQILNLKISSCRYEPLIARDSYYYSHYWVEHILTGDSPMQTVLRRGMSRLVGGALAACFKGLNLFGIKRLGLLKGQSIYVVFTVPEK